MIKTWQSRILLAPNEDGTAGGMPAPPTPQAPAPSSPQTEADGGKQYDDLGYEVVPDASKPPEVAPKPAAQADATKDEKAAGAPADPATGYGAEEPKVDAPAVMPPPPAPAAPPAAQTELDKVIADLPDDEERAKMKAFAEAHKLTPEVAKAYVDLRKGDLEKEKLAVSAREDEMKRAVQTQRANWHKELRDDKTFGGEKFNENVQKVDRVLNEFMPGMKKHLTEKKGMLPPYLMRDLASLADTLYKTQESLVQGDPAASGKEENDDPLNFYGSQNG